MRAQDIIDTPDLIAAGIAGDEVRRRMHGAKTTFVRVFEVHVDAPVGTLPPRTQAGEFRVIGRPASIEVAERAVAAAAALAGGRPVTGFTVDALQELGPLADACRRLRSAGLVAIAQLPLDVVEDVAAAVQQIRDAGLTVNAMTIERLSDDPGVRLEICTRAERLQAETGMFRAFAPLPRQSSTTQPTTGYDDVKGVALARVVVASVPSIQVDWALYGPKMAQVALTAGADDVDNVSAVDPGLLGTRRSPLEEIRTNIKAAALDAVERDGVFHRL